MHLDLFQTAQRQATGNITWQQILMKPPGNFGTQHKNCSCQKFKHTAQQTFENHILGWTDRSIVLRCWEVKAQGKLNRADHSSAALSMWDHTANEGGPGRGEARNPSGYVLHDWRNGWISLNRVREACPRRQESCFQLLERLLYGWETELILDLLQGAKPMPCFTTFSSGFIGRGLSK